MVAQLQLYVVGLLHFRFVLSAGPAGRPTGCEPPPPCRIKLTYVRDPTARNIIHGNRDIV